MVEHFTLRLRDSRMLAPTVRHMTFERVDGGTIPFIPGQFLQIHFAYDDGTPTKRSFSVGTVQPASDDVICEVDFAVSYVEGGAATKLLSGLGHGETIEASGPYGRFCLQDKDRNGRYILIATGTGVTAYRSMLPQMRQMMHERDCRFVLLQGARNEEELLYGDQFDAFAAEEERFTYHPCLSRGDRREPRSHDRRGHVQDMLPELAPDPEADIAYLCGNPDMIDQTYAALKDAGFSARYIRREKYVSSR